MSFAVAALSLSLLATPGPEALFEAGDFDEALRQLDAAVKTEPAGPRRAQLQVSRARCFSALRRPIGDVEEALTLALVDDPVLTVNEAEVSPTFASTLELLRVKLGATVVINTDPPGAAVRINHTLVGSAPTEQRLPVGKHVISALNPSGVEVSSRELVVAPRQRQSVVLSSSAPVVASVGSPVRLGAVVRLDLDFLAGAALEGGASVSGRYWVAELDAVAGGRFGLSLRLGGRLPLIEHRLALVATLDGVGFFAPGFLPGGGGTVAVSLGPFSFLEVLLEGSARFFGPAAGLRSQYGLAAIAVRGSFEL